jgi:hypothetical protein
MHLRYYIVDHVDLQVRPTVPNTACCGRNPARFYFRVDVITASVGEGPLVTGLQPPGS